MKRKLQFAGWLMALGMSAALTMPSFAQGPRANGAQNRQDNKPPKPQSQAPRQQPPRQQPRQEQRQQRQQRQAAQRARNERQNSSANRPPNSNASRPATAQPSGNPNRPPSAYTPPPAKKFDTLPRQEQQKIVPSYRNFEKLTPAQKQQREEAAKNWTMLTPEQKNHIRNDVIPKWKQLPRDRQDAIQHRLAVLRNMPESARNQHLNDPNFTRGMSEEDKAMLHDLSHMHLGAPDPPSE
jgi:hypothetical protein